MTVLPCMAVLFNGTIQSLIMTYLIIWICLLWCSVSPGSCEVDHVTCECDLSTIMLLSLLMCTIMYSVVLVAPSGTFDENKHPGVLNCTVEITGPNRKSARTFWLYDGVQNEGNWSSWNHANNRSIRRGTFNTLNVTNSTIQCVVHLSGQNYIRTAVFRNVGQGKEQDDEPTSSYSDRSSGLQITVGTYYFVYTVLILLFLL